MPIGAVVQTERPVDGAYHPPGHVSVADCFVSLVNWPVGVSVHTEYPVLGANDPMAQSTHTVVPVTPANIPRGQATH